MTPEEQRIAIAEACGRIKRPDGFWYPEGSTVGSQGIPDYCNDLNAMHEAFKSLPKGARIAYGSHLQIICVEAIVGYIPCYPQDFAALARIAHATAAQRAEAFLKTLSLWKQ